MKLKKRASESAIPADPVHGALPPPELPARNRAGCRAAPRSLLKPASPGFGVSAQRVTSYRAPEGSAAEPDCVPGPESKPARGTGPAGTRHQVLRRARLRRQTSAPPRPLTPAQDRHPEPPTQTRDAADRAKRRRAPATLRPRAPRRPRHLRRGRPGPAPGPPPALTGAGRGRSDGGTQGDTRPR